MNTSPQDLAKKAIAEAAAAYLIKHAKGQIIGMGTGSTVNYLIQVLAAYAHDFAGMVSSSEATSNLLKQHGFQVLSLDDVLTTKKPLEFYIDGADEINTKGQMIKGGGGALTREKIVASIAKTFICIADASKKVNTLGAFALPIEVVPAALALVTYHLQEKFPNAKILPRLEKNLEGNSAKLMLTDNQAYILDIHGLKLEDDDVLALEIELKQAVGVIEVGIFAKNKANVLICADLNGLNNTNNTNSINVEITEI